MAFEMTKGMQIAVQTVIKMLGLKPELIELSIVEMLKSLQSAARDMAIIRAQNDAIMAKLGLEPITGDQTNADPGRAIEHRTHVNGGA